MDYTNTDIYTDIYTDMAMLLLARMKKILWHSIESTLFLTATVNYFSMW